MGIKAAKSIFGLLGTAVLSGCTGNLRQVNLDVSDPPSFSVNDNLDLTGLDTSVFTSGDGTADSPFEVNFKEYLAHRELRFKNLTAGAQVECSGTEANPAVRATALNQSTPTIELSPNYFFASESDRAENEIQNFSCWLKNGAESSEQIHFRVHLPETPTVKVSQAGLAAGPFYSHSTSAVISSNGQFVAFVSNMHDLVASDNNQTNDVFIKNLSTGVIERVSVSSAGSESNASSSLPGVSADGRMVVFQSTATNLVAGDTNTRQDIFVHDRQTKLTTRVSVDSSGTEGNNISSTPTISADGRYVSFSSTATNLIAGDTNGQSDIFIHDRQTAATTRVSVDSSGAQVSGSSVNPVLSSDGRYLGFSSTAANLVAGDTNGRQDVFVRDRQTGATTRVSVDSSGTEGNNISVTPTISSDGRYVAFQSFASNLVAGDTNAQSDIFVHDRQTGATTRVSVDSSGTEGNNISQTPTMSSDGRYVSFLSYASNLVAGDTSAQSDIFVHDRQTGGTTRVSVDSSATEGNGASSAPSIGNDGRYVVFSSIARNLIASDTNGAQDIFMHDRQTGDTVRVSVDSDQALSNNTSESPSLNFDGRYIAFSSTATNLVLGDTNGQRDVFVHDRLTGTTTRVSVDSSGTEGNNGSGGPALSADGRYVAFSSIATNLVAGDTNGTEDIFIHDRLTGTTSRVSVDSSGTEGSGTSSYPVLSSDGRYVSFTSTSSNLVVGDTNGAIDVFVHDRQTGATTRVSVDSSGTEANSESSFPSITSDGRYVAFNSPATNLVAGDTNAAHDVFVHDRQTGATTRVSVDSSGTEGNGLSTNSAISGDGRFVAFVTDATNLTPGDLNATYDIYIHDRQTGATSRGSVDSNGLEGNNQSQAVRISADGRYISFYSIATNMVAGDTNGGYDIFVRDLQSGSTIRVSVDSNGVQANGHSLFSVISGDGRYVAFASLGTNLVSGDINGVQDIFVHKAH